MLHLPLEPHQYLEHYPSNYIITTNMRQQRVERLLKENLDEVPFVEGVNNHMGSKATENRRLMSIVFAKLRERKLFFLDSMVTSQSICKNLGHETSCDEPSASVVKDGRDIFSNVISSSLKDHQKYGGIIPEIASRRQLELIHAVVPQAIQEAQLKLEEIDAVAVTKSPGLIGSLLVGVSFARALAFALKKPLIEVDHIKAHLYANFLRFKSKEIASSLKSTPRNDT